MVTEFRILLRPQIENGFTESSFSELLQQQVSVPGLDERWVHTLVGVSVAEEGAYAELTVHSEPPHAARLGSAIRPSFGAPPARVRAFDPDGVELHAGAHPSPLRVGELVAIGDQHYRVGAAHWPGRDPDTGVCAGEIDEQHVVLAPVPDPVPPPAPFSAPGTARPT